MTRPSRNPPNKDGIPGDDGPGDDGPGDGGPGNGGPGDDVDELRGMAARLVRAVDTLGRLPRTADARPAGTRSAWPEMMRDSRFAIEATRRVTAARPTPAAIDDLDRLAVLLWQLPPHQRRLLWARACGVRWVELCHRHRRSRTTLNRDHRRALSALVAAEIAGTGRKSA